MKAQYIFLVAMVTLLLADTAQCGWLSDIFKSTESLGEQAVDAVVGEANNVAEATGKVVNEVDGALKFPGHL